MSEACRPWFLRMVIAHSQTKRLTPYLDCHNPLLAGGSPVHGAPERFFPVALNDRAEKRGCAAEDVVDETAARMFPHHYRPGN